MFQNQSKKIGSFNLLKNKQRDPSLKLIESESTINQRISSAGRSNKFMSDENITLLAIKQILSDPRLEQLPQQKFLQRKDSDSFGIKCQESIINSLYDSLSKSQIQPKRQSNENIIKTLIDLNILEPISNQNRHFEKNSHKNRIERSFKDKQNNQEQQEKMYQSKQRNKYITRNNLSLQEIIQAEESSFGQTPSKIKTPKNSNVNKDHSYEVYEPQFDPPMDYLFSNLQIQNPRQNFIQNIIMQQDLDKEQEEDQQFFQSSVLKSIKKQKQFCPSSEIIISTIRKIPKPLSSEIDQNQYCNKQLQTRMEQVQKRQIQNKNNLLKLQLLYQKEM